MATEQLTTIISVNVDAEKANADFTKATNEIKKLRDETATLRAEQKKLDLSVDENQKRYDEITIQIAKNTAEIKTNTTVLSATQKVMNATASDLNDAAGAYQRLSNEASAAKQIAKDLAVVFGEDSKQARDAALAAGELDKRLKTIDSSMGDNWRRVGTYTDATWGLRSSMNMLASELPNIANGLRTFTMSISNNLPMAINAIGELRKQNKLLAEEGKPQISILKTIGSSFFGLAGMANIAMLAFQLLTPKISEWYDAMFKSEKQTEETKKAISTLNDAMKDGGAYKTAIENVQKINSAQKMYLKGIITSDEFTKIYNDTLGDTFGKAKNAGGAIGLMAQKSNEYIKAMKNMTYANALFAASAELMVKTVQEKTKSNSEILGSGSKKYIKLISEATEDRKKIQSGETVWEENLMNGVWVKRRVTLEEALKKENEIRAKYNDLRKTQEAKNVSKFENQQKALEKSAQQFAENAQKIASKSGIDLTPEKEKSDREKKATDETKKNAQDVVNHSIDLMYLELDNWLAIQEEKKKASGLTNAELIKLEEERVQKEYEINKSALEQRYSAGIISKDEYDAQIKLLETNHANAVNEVKRQADDFDKERRATDLQNEIALKEEGVLSQFEAKQMQLDAQYKQDIDNANKTGADKTLIEKQYAADSKAIEEASTNAKFDLAAGFAGNLKTIFGENTKVGKAAAVAETTINTYKSATAAYASLASIPIVGPALGVAAATAAVVAGAANVKKILAVKAGSTPSGGGGGSTASPSPSIAATTSGAIVSRSLSSQTSTADTTKQAVSSAMGENKVVPVLVTNDLTTALDQKVQITNSNSL